MKKEENASILPQAFWEAEKRKKKRMLRSSAICHYRRRYKLSLHQPNHSCSADYPQHRNRN